MPVEASRFVLGEHQDFTKVAIEAVGKREIDDAIKPAKGYCRFCTVSGEGLETGAFAACKNQG